MGSVSRLKGSQELYNLHSAEEMTGWLAGLKEGPGTAVTHILQSQ
jgi:hypothetical protein